MFGKSYKYRKMRPIQLLSNSKLNWEISGQNHRSPLKPMSGEERTEDEGWDLHESTRDKSKFYRKLQEIPWKALQGVMNPILN